MSAGGKAGSAVSAAGRAGNSDALENLARVGLIAYGIVHLLIAWLALQLAWGGGGNEAGSSFQPHDLSSPGRAPTDTR